jgi:hypothetical protein
MSIAEATDVSVTAPRGFTLSMPRLSVRQTRTLDASDAYDAPESTIGFLNALDTWRLLERRRWDAASSGWRDRVYRPRKTPSELHNGYIHLWAYK